MIPKIIHYCWFGGLEKPKKVMKYIETWKKHLPDYEIIEWNENNFPVNYCDYTLEAYKAKKYAFVSDVARLYALKEYGGIYFDTDIEVLKSLNEYLDCSMILSFESESLLMTGFVAASKGNKHICALLEEYNNRNFTNADGSLNVVANTVFLTEYMKNNGLVCNCRNQIIDNDIYVYTNKIFGAFDADNSYFDINENTVLVHRCMASWGSKKFKVKFFIMRILAKVLGVERYKKLRLKLKGIKNKTTTANSN